MPESGVVRSRFRRHAWLAGSTIAFVVVAVLELCLRLGLGLGDPPRLEADPNCEYRLVPSRTYRRFGNRIAVNEWSMRSGRLPRHKHLASELRILVLGDSIINGGAPTDQADLGTTLLEQRLGQALAPRNVRVGNVSAGSWGPENIAGYVREFGLFDADWVLIVLSTHDLSDVMSGKPPQLPPEYSGPLAGVTEALTTFVPRLLPGLAGKRARDGAAQQAPGMGASARLDTAKIERTRQALRELGRSIDDAGIPALVLLHPEVSELEAPLPARAELRRTVQEAGFAVVDLIPVFRAAVQQGKEPYRDEIHLSAEGQEYLAQAFFDAIAPALGATGGTP